MTHGLAARHLADHSRRRIRGSQLAPESLGDMTAEPARDHDDRDGAEGRVVVPLHSSRSRRDGAERVGAIVPLDSDKRASLAKPLAALGWDPTTELVAEIRGHRVVVRPGVPTTAQPWLTPVRARGGRLTLPPTVTGALGVDGGDQVLAVALRALAELHLAAACDVLQDFTGELPSAAPVAAPPLAPSAPAAPKSRIRPAVGHAAPRSNPRSIRPRRTSRRSSVVSL